MLFARNPLKLHNARFIILPSGFLSFRKIHQEQIKQSAKIQTLFFPITYNHINRRYKQEPKCCRTNNRRSTVHFTFNPSVNFWPWTKPSTSPCRLFPQTGFMRAELFSIALGCGLFCDLDIREPEGLRSLLHSFDSTLPLPLPSEFQRRFCACNSSSHKILEPLAEYLNSLSPTLFLSLELTDNTLCFQQMNIIDFSVLYFKSQDFKNSVAPHSV